MSDNKSVDSYLTTEGTIAILAAILSAPRCWTSVAEPTHSDFINPVLAARKLLEVASEQHLKGAQACRDELWGLHKPLDEQDADFLLSGSTE